MATDTFEMETGQRFVDWIEKHPKLSMRYQPLEISVRKLAFYFPLACALGGAIVTLVGCWQYGQAGFPLAHLGGAFLFLLVMGAVAGGLATEKIRGGMFRALISMMAIILPVGLGLGIFLYGRPAGLIVLGICSTILFGALALRGLLALLRAQDFELTLADGVFNLRHGKHAETFNVNDLKQVCVVRPGTVGATEGALGFKDDRMLTLDTCLSDLHALGVVLDLRFREDFPPSADDIAKVRRDKLRKIRGLE